VGTRTDTARVLAEKGARTRPGRRAGVAGPPEKDAWSAGKNARKGLQEVVNMEKHSIEYELSLGLDDVKVIGRYEIVRRLGQGATGVVVLARDPYINRQVAIKISKPVSDRARQTFFVEAQSAGRLNHPNIVAVYDAGVFKDYCYITMEFVEGATLDAYCKKENLLPLGQVVEIVFSACNALDYAHKQGVIHRDIKPSNIMLDKGGALKITDFGIAQMAEETAPVGLFGTPSYMSPEQLKDEVVGIQSDVFALGCVLYELVTGRQAFSGDNSFAVMYKITSEDPEPMARLRPEVPPILDQIATKALAKDLSMRYANCMDFAYDLRVAYRGVKGQGRTEKTGLVDYVQNVSFFKEFGREEIQELVDAGETLQVPKGKIIVAEGEIDDSFYIILSGKAKVRQKEKDMALIGAGECFGETAYLGGMPRISTVVAALDCTLLKISATLLDKASEALQLRFYKTFTRLLVDRLSRSARTKPV